jgi:hypothetical protein
VEKPGNLVREKIRAFLLKQALELLSKCSDIPVHSEIGGQTVRIGQNPAKTKYIIYIEAEVDSKMEQWAAVFRNFNTFQFTQKVMPQCTFSEVVDRDADDFHTTITTFKFPMISERLVINTDYPLLHHTPDSHLFLGSGLGSQHLYTADIVGETRYRSCVNTVNDLSFY